MIDGGFTRGNPNPHWHSIDSMTSPVQAPQAGHVSGAWPTANLAIYIPVMVRARVVVKQLWYSSVSTGTGNYDLGLYDGAGSALLRRGSTAKPASSVEVVWDCTDTTIDPGIYYLALVSSNATDTFLSYTLTAPTCAAVGIWSETSALPLPATATFAMDQTLAFVPIVGMFLDTRVA